MREKRKKQRKRNRPVQYTRSVDIYGHPFVVVSKRGVAPETRRIGKK